MDNNFLEFVKKIQSLDPKAKLETLNVIIEVQKNKNGKVRRHETTYTRRAGCDTIFPSHHDFSEGRMSCDCQRKAIFLQDVLQREYEECMATGKEPKQRNFNHGTGAYSVNLYLVDRLPGEEPIERCFYREFGDPPAGTDQLQ